MEELQHQVNNLDRGTECSLLVGYFKLRWKSVQCRARFRGVRYKSWMMVG